MVRMSFQPALLSLLKRSKCSMRSIKTCRARPSCRKILIAKKRLPGPRGSSPSSVDGADTLPISRQDPLHSTMAWPVSRLSPADGLSKMCRCPSAKAGHQRPRDGLCPNRSYVVTGSPAFAGDDTPFVALIYGRALSANIVWRGGFPERDLM